MKYMVGELSSHPDCVANLLNDASFLFLLPCVSPQMHVGRVNGVRHRDMDGYDDSEAVYVNHTGQMNGGGRGRGRGGRSYRSSRYDKGPQIDTWTNETAENAEKENKSWGEMTEDWTTDEWTGSVSVLLKWLLIIFFFFFFSVVDNIL